LFYLTRAPCQHLRRAPTPAARRSRPTPRGARPSAARRPACPPPRPPATMARPSRGRVCHQVLIFIRTCAITAMIVCSFERDPWSWERNGRPARRLARPPRSSAATTRRPARRPAASRKAPRAGRAQWPPPPPPLRRRYGRRLRPRVRRETLGAEWG
jgi:hypothetical protein